MAFSPWHWVVTTGHAYTALIAPMALLTPWRLPLLFAVSGFATRHLLRPGFVAQRNARLLVPLGFALIALLPPEMWVRAREAGYAGSLARFWLVDGWNPTPAGRMGFPAWEHLWFVVYLWTYTMLLAVAPDPATYSRAREDGLRGYCTFQRGWIEGRAGNAYYGVCRPEEEAAFLPAYNDGRRLHEAAAAVEAAESALRSAEARIDWTRSAVEVERLVRAMNPAPGAWFELGGTWAWGTSVFAVARKPGGRD
mgnify:CR=1 FL=1